MKDNPILGITAALRDAGIGVYRIEDGAVVKTGGHNRDSQAWSGISIRLDHDEAFIVELELTLNGHLAESAEEAELDLRVHFEARTGEVFELSGAALDPVWGHWCCSVSQRCHGTDEAVRLVDRMLGWEF